MLQFPIFRIEYLGRSPRNIAAVLFFLASFPPTYGSVSAQSSLVIHTDFDGKTVANFSIKSNSPISSQTPIQFYAANQNDSSKQLEIATQKQNAIQSKLNAANIALRSAERSLAAATRKSDTLKRQADATIDTRQKVALLKEQLNLSKTMLTVTRERDRLVELINALKSNLAAADAEIRRANRSIELDVPQQQFRGTPSPEPKTDFKYPDNSDRELKLVEDAKKCANLQSRLVDYCGPARHKLISKMIPDYAFGNFAQACEYHDYCYWHTGITLINDIRAEGNIATRLAIFPAHFHKRKSECDESFRRNLRSVCGSLSVSCKLAADVYFRAVDKLGTPIVISSIIESVRNGCHLTRGSSP